MPTEIPTLEVKVVNPLVSVTPTALRYKLYDHFDGQTPKDGKYMIFDNEKGDLVWDVYVQFYEQLTESGCCLRVNAGACFGDPSALEEGRQKSVRPLREVDLGQPQLLLPGEAVQYVSPKNKTGRWVIQLVEHR